LLEVAQLVGEATGGRDPELVVAALLHDAIEDCEIQPATIEAEFGADVRALVQAVTEAETDDLEELLKLLHERSRGTRGAAAGLAVINRASGRLTFAGLGNIHIRVLGTNKWRGVSRDGILGERMRHFLPQSVALACGDLVVMASDGISESSRSSSLVRGSSLSASELCDRLLEESGKRTDDASCVVVKCL
jgi:hypothetical protein